MAVPIAPAAPPVQEDDETQSPQMGRTFRAPSIPRVRAVPATRLGQVNLSRGREDGRAFFGQGGGASFQPAQQMFASSRMGSGFARPAKAHFMGQETAVDPDPLRPMKDKSNENRILPVGEPILEPVKEIRRRAWGRIKKMDAAELAAYLAAIEQRMVELGIPPGIVPKIRAKLEGFSESPASESAEIELTQEEGVALDGAIMLLETKEQSTSFVTAAVVIAGVGILITALV
jgi:hypothetical protein